MSGIDGIIQITSQNCDEAGGQTGFKHGTDGLKGCGYTVEKENQIFLIYKEIQSGGRAS
jgi:hypothetical protein